MKKTPLIIPSLALLALGLLASCDSDSSTGSGSGSSASSLVGTWRTISVDSSVAGYRYVDTMYVTFAADGREAEIHRDWSQNLSTGNRSLHVDTFTGTWSVSGNILTGTTTASTESSEVGSTGSTTFSVSGSTLTLSGTGSNAFIEVYTRFSDATTIPTIGGGSSTTPTGTVASPTFSPAGGSYVTAQTVILSSATSGATIYYTIDGSTPTTASMLYTGAITVSSSKTLRAIAVKSGLTTSAMVSVVYTISSSSTTTSTIPWNTSITYGSLTDSRDGKVYRTVVIGSQTWMAENLNYVGTSAAPVGVWYNNSADSGAKYGRLYTWVEVMQGASSSITSPSGVKGICPTGWHVPSDAEWQTLEVYVGMSATSAESTFYRGTIEGNKLKAISSWNEAGNGTDSYGFRILPAGISFSSSRFQWLGGSAYFWTASIDASLHDPWTRYFRYGGGDVSRDGYDRYDGLSLRCLKD